MARTHWIALALVCGCGGSAVSSIVSAGNPDAGTVAQRSSLSIALLGVAGSAGTVTVTSGGAAPMTCGSATCTMDVAQGTPVTLSALSADGDSMFGGWSGECAASADTCTLTMNEGKDVTATFRPHANLMFQTSVSLPMPFGATAAEAQKAADRFCNARAFQGRLPGHYFAWLSTSTADAIDKLGNANGWLRPDGLPFANSRQDLIAQRILYPPVVGEKREDLLFEFQAVATGTRDDGTVFPGNTCNDWTSTAGTTRGVGEQASGSQGWTAAPYSLPCAGPFALYCFEASQNATVTAASKGRIAFVSKEAMKPGPDTSRATADAICQSEAQDAGLSGDFLALLAVTGETPLDRFSKTGAPWVRTDGVALVDLASDIGTQVRLLAPLDVNADQTYVPTSDSWTGSLGPALAGDKVTTCHDWSSTDGSGNGGQVEYAIQWFDEYQGSITCEAAEPVYCFQK